MTLETCAALKGMTKFTAKNYLILSKIHFAMEHQDKIFIHPDSVIRQTRNFYKREAAKLIGLPIS